MSCCLSLSGEILEDYSRHSQVDSDIFYHFSLQIFYHLLLEYTASHYGFKSTDLCQLKNSKELQAYFDHGFYAFTYRVTVATPPILTSVNNMNSSIMLARAFLPSACRI